MEITRIFTDTQGDSHFELIPVHMQEKSELGYFSSPEENLSRMYFRNCLPRHEWDFHLASKTIQIAILNGALEVEVSNGEKKRFETGEVILLDDQSGKGHKVKTFEHAARILVIHMD